MPTSCVIFDFDGVIADTESLHLQAYNHAFKEHAPQLGRPLVISHEAYYSTYIAYGDREAIQHMLADAQLPDDAALLNTLCHAKEHLFASRLADFAQPLPGVHDLLTWLEARGVPRAICSGAQRREIEILLNAFHIRNHFDIIVTIEDVRLGKPDPEGYNTAFDKLHIKYDATLNKSTSLVIEDSAGGCAAAKAAGIPVLAVATSLPLKEVQRHATHAVADLSKLDLTQLAQWLAL